MVVTQDHKRFSAHQGLGIESGGAEGFFASGWQMVMPESSGRAGVALVGMALPEASDSKL